MISSARQLAETFLKLPFHCQAEVSQLLGFNIDHKGNVMESFARAVFKSAKESNKVEQLRFETYRLANLCHL